MESIGLSPEEKRVLQSFLIETFGRRFGWYASVIGPITIFAVYGFLKLDLIAVELAFVCLLGWSLRGLVGYREQLGHYRSLSKKVLDFEEQSQREGGAVTGANGEQPGGKQKTP
jgi:hypothetical protein